MSGPSFDPFMLHGLSYTEALQQMRLTDCAVRRDHWCAPVVRLVDGRPMLDDEGDLSPLLLLGDDRRARDWGMIPNPATDGVAS
ncbi:hypothetical protein [Phenylobacterium sp.]|uniref:hypothetical protein n=1 Tax=Phenylobacterium sp. TaxID=1871053 RepID=UPI0027355FFF|nr:hypothetical protein [Phenylobacterium sp.]MDP3853647.1 hypothetical protein [Phenylobacterium sp.]